MTLPFGRSTLVVVRKELRALFQSPVALIFLTIFLAAALFLFFTQARFFARGLADVRPLFQWMPLLLILLVSAITMRAWAEERRSGTLEVLMTLPVRTWDLVMGKFLAGLGLVALGLALTCPLPLVVWSLGPLDWGPVVGGYFASLLLAGAYLAVGLCVSARTDNQVVALMVTLVVGIAMWLVGSETLTSLFSQEISDVLRLIGTGARFESVERGVLDLRDIVYYGSITVFFLGLNAYFLDRERLDAGSAEGGRHNVAMIVTLLLVGGNALLANLWLRPVNQARIDMTANGDYSLSDVTAGTLAKLDEPLRIRGLFSDRTHPLLAPLVPQIKDTLTEYAVASGGTVTVDFADPSKDEDLEGEINERYSIKSVPFGVADAHSQSVLNAYFHILLLYGDKHEVLSFEDLVEVHADPAGMQVKLKNLEYDLTRSVKKVSQDFVGIDQLIAKLPAPARLTLYVGGAVPPTYETSIGVFERVAQQIAAVDPAKVTFERIDPTTDPALQQRLLDEYAIQPLAADLFGSQQFYMHFVIQVGTEAQRLVPRAEIQDPEVQKMIEAAFRRVTPGQLRRVALVVEEPKPTNPNLPPNMQAPPPPPDFRYIEQLLGQNFQVERTQLTEGYVKEDIDVVIVGKIGEMTDKQKYALDQFLMRGGSIIAFSGAWRIEATNTGIEVAQEPRSLRDLLEVWGVAVDDAMVMADQVAPMPLPSERTLPNGIRLPEIRLVPYPFFPDLRGAELNEEHPALAGIVGLTMPWSSPVHATSDTLEDRKVEWLVKSTDNATQRSDGKIDPDEMDPRDGPVWRPGPVAGEVTLALAVTGRFPSFFTDKANPTLTDASGPDSSGRTIKKSVADGRLVVVGSSEFTSDLLQAIAMNTQSEIHSGNVQLVQNVLDWSVEDTDLLSIRTASAYARTLRPTEESESRAVQIKTWVLTFVLLGGVLAVPWVLRRNTAALPAAPVEAA